LVLQVSKTSMPGTRLVLGPVEGRTRVPGMTVDGTAFHNVMAGTIPAMTL
jgi:hypothetical protein